MALTEDQRALLQLLLNGGQSYADIGSLLGVDQTEVRARARRALTEIGGADPDAQVGLTDYLLGQADPIGRADAARHLQSDPEASALAARLAAQLRLLAPGARLPELPAAPAQASPASASASASAAAAPAASNRSSAPGKGSRAAGGARSAVEKIGGAAAGLGARKRRLPVVLGVVGLVVLVGVLLATGVIGGSGDDNPSAATTATNGAASDVAVISLKPQDGSKAGGQATFTVAQGQPVLQINLFGLKPNGPDETYIVSLYRSEDETLPVARSNAGKDGNLTGAAALPAQVGATLGPQGFNQIDVSLASSSETQKALQAASANKQLPKRSGVSVLRGNIPASAAAIASSASSAATSTSTNPTSSTPSSTTP
jgi:hypothetical protein